MRFSEYITLTESFVEHPQSRRLGSNPGGTFVHQPSGEHYYIKFPHNLEQAHVEVATAKLYNAMGIKTLNPSIVNVDGRVGVAAKWDHGVKSLTSPSQYHELMMTPKHADMIGRLHHAAIVTGNRDIVGLDHTNVMYDKRSDELVSADQGGSMHFRAMGDKKPFIGEIGDVYSFQNPEYASGQVFGRLNRSWLVGAASHLDKLSDELIDSVANEHGISREKANVIKQRRDLLKQHFS